MEEITLFERLPKEKLKQSYFKICSKKQIVEIIVYFFILLFTYSSIRKLLDYKMFVREIYGYSVIESVKWGLAVFSFGELITAITLAISKARLLGLIAAFMLMVVLNITGFIILQKAPVIPALFGGIFPKTDFFGHLLVNLIILFIALVGVLLFIQLKEKRT